MVLESSSPIKKDTNHQIFASNCRCKGGWRLKSVLLPAGMLFVKSHSVILKRLFPTVFRFGTSCLCYDLVASELSSVMDGST